MPIFLNSLSKKPGLLLHNLRTPTYNTNNIGLPKKNLFTIFAPEIMETAHLHFKIYKPFGMLSQFMSNDAKEARKKRFLSDLDDFPEGIMPVGRLDEKSEGLLLLTTDGKLSDLINRSGIEKEYYVQLDGEITSEAIERLEEGVEIGFSGKKYQTKSCKVQSLIQPPLLPEADKKLRLARHRPNSWISITITEGKFRQVRKMTAAVGFPTLRLIRVRIADIHLKDLLPGTVVSIPYLPLDNHISRTTLNEFAAK